LDRLGRYIILETLDKGGTAEVSAAIREGSQTLCVLKRLHLDLSTSANARRRLYREAHLASLLDHPNIGRVIDAGFEGDDVYIAIELIPGQTVISLIRAALEKGRLIPPPISVCIAAEALSALHYAHGLGGPDGRPLGIVHRDLSPRNVMVSYEGDVKIIDFGVARAHLDDFRTQPGIVLGTIRYVSPEQALAEPIDGRSDLYSLGVIAYEMLSGARVTPKADTQSILLAIAHDAPKPLAEANPAISARLASVVMRALEKSPGDRWPTAAAFRGALLDCADAVATREQVGAFVRELFPDQVAHTRALVDRARNVGPRTASVTFAPFDDIAREESVPTRADMVRPTSIQTPDALVITTEITEPDRRDPTEEQTSISEAELPDTGITPQVTPKSAAVPIPERAAPTRPLARRISTLPVTIEQRSPAAVLVIGVAVVALLSIGYAVGRLQGTPDPIVVDEPASPPVVPRAEVRPPKVDEVEPIEEERPIQPAEDLEPPAPRKVRRRHDPPPPNGRPNPYAGLRAQLEAVDARPDRAAFLALHAAIASASRRDLGADARARVDVHLDSAELTLDVKNLEAALRELERGGSNRKLEERTTVDR
jgi:serine/threonine-protein kinase